MISLCLDTATEGGVVGVFRDGLLLAKKEFQAAFTNSKLLMPSIQEVCAAAEITPAMLTYIGCGIGPGSYTGIRVAVAVAKAIMAALSIPLVGVSSLAGFVPESSFEGRFLAALDARTGGVYVMEGEMRGRQVVFVSPPQIVSTVDFAHLASSVSCIVTHKALPLRERLFAMGVMELPLCIERYASIEIIGLLSHEAFLRGEGVLDGVLELCYLRSAVNYATTPSQSQG